mmetsp:Transcript_32062/g.78679  ORF Transcript_32062/g.78679 Transcript_32062/m.78679 type:complete len:225 (-) Transcript_32062:497-1171(-)
MTVADPSVSIISVRLIRTFFLAIFPAASIFRDVIEPRSPWGTLATMTTMKPLINVERNGKPLPIPMAKRMMAVMMARIAMKLTKRSISFCSRERSPDVCEARVAMLPMKVWSPVLYTTPKHSPFMTSDDEKIRFLASITTSEAFSTWHGMARLSPVREEHSTLQFVLWITRMSAGTLSPRPMRTMSPVTSSVGSIRFSWPSRTTVHCVASIPEIEFITLEACFS